MSLRTLVDDADVLDRDWCPSPLIWDRFRVRCATRCDENEGNVSGEELHGLTRPKISDRWRERASLLVECGSHGKLERGAASGSLHRMVR